MQVGDTSGEGRVNSQERMQSDQGFMQDQIIASGHMDVNC